MLCVLLLHPFPRATAVKLLTLPLSLFRVVWFTTVLKYPPEIKILDDQIIFPKTSVLVSSESRTSKSGNEKIFIRSNGRKTTFEWPEVVSEVISPRI